MAGDKVPHLFLFRREQVQFPSRDVGFPLPLLIVPPPFRGRCGLGATLCKMYRLRPRVFPLSVLPLRAHTGFFVSSGAFQMMLLHLLELGWRFGSEASGYCSNASRLARFFSPES